jgi:4-hydroxy-tetrahydrodipicolinate synthase
MNRFRGVVVPMLSPLRADASLDRPALHRYVDFLLGNGVHALFALSSTGEFCALPWPTQCDLVEETLVQVKGRVPLCAGVSTQCLADSISRARDLARIGVDAVVSLPPFYFRTSQQELLAYFAAIADASPVPLLVYNMPFRTQHNIEPDTVFALREHGNIIGLKDTVNDRERTRLLAGALRGDSGFHYLHGNELLTLEAASLGAHGSVPSIANLAPRFMVDAFCRAARGDVQQADLDGIAALMPAFGLFESRPQESTTLRLMALKAILQQLGVMDAHMAQLAPPLCEQWRERARRFAVEHRLTGRSDALVLPR